MRRHARALLRALAGNNDLVAIRSGTGDPAHDPRTAVPATAQRYVGAIRCLQTASLGGQARAVLGYSGRSGDGGRGDHLLSAGLHIAF